MALKIQISVTVSDADRHVYQEPSGFESVDLYALSENEIVTVADTITSALVKVAGAKYRAAISEKEQK